MNEISDERVFFCTKEGAHKFWRICVQNETQTVCWGRIGTLGQALTRTFSDADEAESAAKTLIAQKIAKGYAEVSRDEANAVVPVPVQRTRSPSAVAACQLLLGLDDNEAKPAETVLSASPIPSLPLPPSIPLALFEL